MGMIIRTGQVIESSIASLIVVYMKKMKCDRHAEKTLVLYFISFNMAIRVGYHHHNIERGKLHTSIASDTPGIDAISPPMTFSLKSRFFCRQKH